MKLRIYQRPESTTDKIYDISILTSYGAEIVCVAGNNLQEAVATALTCARVSAKNGLLSEAMTTDHPYRK